MTLNIANLDRLIARMESLRDDQFNMQAVFTVGKNMTSGYIPETNSCGTAACIAGECGLLSDALPGTLWSIENAANWMGIDWRVADKLFAPRGYSDPSNRYPLPRAIRTLKHLRAEFLRTGNVVVDWDAPEAVEPPRKAWAPPLVIGADKPLPAEMTRLVREPASSLVTEV